jgi:hypothetical protein
MIRKIATPCQGDEDGHGGSEGGAGEDQITQASPG